MFPLTVSHFEADSGNLTLHLQEKLAHLREARPDLVPGRLRTSRMGMRQSQGESL